MAKITRIVPLTLLKEWGLPWDEEVVLSTKEHYDGGHRWTNDVECIIKAPDDGLTYQFWYQRGKSESQDMAWYETLSETVELVRVELRTATTVKVREKWRVVDPDAPDMAPLVDAAIERLATSALDLNLRARIIHELAGQYGQRAACALNTVQRIEQVSGEDLRDFLGQEASERILAAMRTEAGRIVARELSTRAENLTAAAR